MSSSMSRIDCAHKNIVLQYVPLLYLAFCSEICRPEAEARAGDAPTHGTLGQNLLEIRY